MSKMLAMKLHEKLEQLCLSRRWTQKSLLEAIADPEVKKSSMSNWFNGKHQPDLQAGLKIARALGVPLEYLADDAQDDPPAPELSEEDRAVIELVHALKLGKQEALRRLATPIDPRPLSLPDRREVEITHESAEKPKPTKRGTR